ncbi:hypothetical protein HY632_02345 [Candidatus Uhrbacteria bacterium]|nr:hypothetical protein [Candidatus Uhrbacteria bacterium]
MSENPLHDEFMNALRKLIAREAAAPNATHAMRIAKLEKRLAGAVEQIQHLEDEFASLGVKRPSGSQTFLGKKPMDPKDGELIRERRKQGIPKQDIQREFRKKGYTARQIAAAYANDSGGHRARRNPAVVDAASESDPAKPG